MYGDRVSSWSLRTSVVAMLAGGYLAFIAGYLDGVFFRVSGVAVTHMTGSAARMSADVVTDAIGDAIRMMSILGAFCVGAAVSGFIVGTQRLRIGRRYGVALIIESLLLGLSATCFEASLHTASLLAAAAAGLQNAMASTYAGMIVRTTHITGIATDLGFLAGRWLRDRRVEPWRLVLLLLLLGGFLTGAGAGTLAGEAHGSRSLWPLAATVMIAGVSHLLWRLRRES